MTITIHNPHKLAMKRPVILGAALLIVIAGPDLRRDELRRASGMSKWHWDVHGAEVRKLARDMAGNADSRWPV